MPKKVIYARFSFRTFTFYSYAGDFICFTAFHGRDIRDAGDLYAWLRRGRNSVQVGDSLSMGESWQPCFQPIFGQQAPSTSCARYVPRRSINFTSLENTVKQQIQCDTVHVVTVHLTAEAISVFALWTILHSPVMKKGRLGVGVIMFSVSGLYF